MVEKELCITRNLAKEDKLFFLSNKKIIFSYTTKVVSKTEKTNKPIQTKPIILIWFSIIKIVDSVWELWKPIWFSIFLFLNQ